MTKRQALEMCPAFAAITAQTADTEVLGELSIAIFAEAQTPQAGAPALLMFDGIFTTDDVVPHVTDTVKRFSPRARWILIAKYRAGEPKVLGSDLVTLGEITAATDIKVLDFIIVGDDAKFVSVLRSGMIEDIVCPHCGALDFYHIEKAENCDLEQENAIHFEDCAFLANVREADKAHKRGKAVAA